MNRSWAFQLASLHTTSQNTSSPARGRASNAGARPAPKGDAGASALPPPRQGAARTFFLAAPLAAAAGLAAFLGASSSLCVAQEGGGRRCEDCKDAAGRGGGGRGGAAAAAAAAGGRRLRRRRNAGAAGRAAGPRAPQKPQPMPYGKATFSKGRGAHAPRRTAAAHLGAVLTVVLVAAVLLGGLLQGA
jgi:hypothetical protein